MGSITTPNDVPGPAALPHWAFSGEERTLMCRTVAVLAGLVFASAVSADVYADCAQAVAAGDQVAARRFAEQIVRFSPVPGTVREAAEVCISFGLGDGYLYVDDRQRFMSEPERVAREKSRQEQDLVLKELEAARRAEREAVAEARRVENLRRRQLEEAASAAVVARQAAVWRRVIDACEQLYERRPDETVTNSVCLEVFLERGLPPG